MATKSWSENDKIRAEKFKEAKKAEDAMKALVTSLNRIADLCLKEFETAEEVDTLFGFSPIHPKKMMQSARQFMARVGGEHFAWMQVGYFDLHKTPDFTEALKLASMWTTKLKPNAKSIL